ncbi:hypothetical protein [Nitrosomonas sp.]|uniref:hypothetical protein n=1 Tax=Nitrosomonas sp. TaxID=42353 RepID=UPI0025EB3309|nr:hypothetical protein [Nitrosomonas sp.]
MPDLEKQPIPPLSLEEALHYIEIINKATEKFHGQIEELHNAIGMLMTGRLFGWRVLVIFHNKRTIRKYEEILCINIREMFPPEGPLAYKSIGYDVACKLSNFWKAVSGDIKIDNRREIGNI